MTAALAIPTPVEVDPPAIERYAYGLLSAARIATEPDLHWEGHGVVYPADSCAPGGGVWPHPCSRLAAGPTNAYLISIDKPAGADQLFVTVLANAYGPFVPITVTVAGANPQELIRGERSRPWTVAPSAQAAVKADIPATGTYPLCTNTINVAVPATAEAFHTEAGCVVTIPVTDDPTKTLDFGLQLVEGWPFTVYEGLSCSALSVPEVAQRAERRLALHEQFWVERTFDETQLRHNAVTLGTPGTAVPLVQGIGLLEDAIAERYGGIGVVHVPRQLGSNLVAKMVVRRDGPRLRTPLENLYAMGAGYSGNGPNNAAPAAGQTWLYATGPVTARRGEIQTREAFDQRKNLRVAIAERAYSLTADCLRVGVLVTIPAE